GSGAGSRHSLGTTVLGGMIASTFLNLAFIPVLYVVVEGWRERRKHGGAEPAHMRVVARPDASSSDSDSDDTPQSPCDSTRSARHVGLALRSESPKKKISGAGSLGSSVGPRSCSTAARPERSSGYLVIQSSCGGGRKRWGVDRGADRVGGTN